jgi:hypothetical protein
VKLQHPRTIAFTLWIFLFAASPDTAVQAQTAGAPAPAQTQSPQPATQGAQPESNPSTGHSTVLFSRSTDDPQTAPTGIPPKAPAQPPAAPADPAIQKAADEERTAATFTAYDLDIRLLSHQKGVAVRARLTLRNDGDAPLKHLRLQLCSTLTWERLQIDGKPARFNAHSVPTDADHTGRVTEAVIDLPTPLAPKASIAVDAIYSGPIPLTGQRLEDLGTPADIAQRADWDELSDDEVVLRGFGDVVWYPASSVPVALGDGDKYFEEIGRQRLRQSTATFQASVTEEFIGDPPNLAVVNGRVEPLTVTAMPATGYPGIATFAAEKRVLGFIAPSLFVLHREEFDGDDIQVYAVSGADPAAAHANAQNYLAAAVLVDPLIHAWLGGHPKTPLAVIDMPQLADPGAGGQSGGSTGSDPGVATFQSGAALFTSLGGNGPGSAQDSALDAAPANAPASQNTQQIALTLSSALAHVYFQSPRAWLDEGVAHFLSDQWIAQAQSRDAVIEANEPLREALALAEPASPGDGPGQPLITASDPIYYRTKAAFVLGMLRDIAGEATLSAALHAYVGADDTQPGYFEGLIEKASGKDLKWFFDDWVYRDQGLPDLSIVNVFPTRASVPGQFLVTIEVANDGYAEAEVPITVISQDTSITDRVRVPARGRATHRIVIQGRPNEVQVNDGSVPEVQEAIHRQAITTINGS